VFVTDSHDDPNIGERQPKARYKGLRKNTLDVRRVAVVANLQRIARLPAVA